MVVGEEDENAESFEEAWLSDVNSDVDGRTESGTSSTENLQGVHLLEETKSMVGQHLQRRLEALRSEEESWGELAAAPPRVLLLTLASRLDSQGKPRPSRTSFMFDRFDPLLFDFPLLPPELVPHRSDGTAERVSEELVKVTSDLLLEEPFASSLLGGSRVIVTAGQVAKRVGNIVGKKLGKTFSHVPHPSKWRQLCGLEAYKTLCGAHAAFQDTVTEEIWKERVASAHRAYAAIMWELLPEERKEGIAEIHRQAWANLPVERKEEFALDIRVRWVNLPEERKREIVENHRQAWANLSNERKEEIAAKHSFAWSSLSKERQLDIIEKRRQAWPAERKAAWAALRRQDWEDLPRERKDEIASNIRLFWRTVSDARKEEISQKKRSAAQTRSPRRQEEVRRNMMLAHAERPQEYKDKLAQNKSVQWSQTPSDRKDKIRDNKRKAWDSMSEDTKKKRKFTFSASCLKNLEEDINSKYTAVQESSQPLSKRERNALQKRLNSADVPEELRHKFEALEKLSCDTLLGTEASATSSSSKSQEWARLSQEKKREIGEKHTLAWFSKTEEKRELIQKKRNLTRQQKTPEELEQQKIKTFQTNLAKFIQDVEDKYEDMVIRKRVLTRREQLTLRKRMNTSYKTTKLPDGLREKYEKLAAASLSSNGI